eukprot:m.125139 g.125139  ORF g.125139 m.125139 type:complete len:360 (-) comp13527_c0_seq1:1321-2400(-)
MRQAAWVLRNELFTIGSVHLFVRLVSPHLPHGHLAVMSIRVVVLLDTGEVGVVREVCRRIQALVRSAVQARWDCDVAFLVVWILRSGRRRLSEYGHLTTQKLACISVPEFTRDASRGMTVAARIHQHDARAGGACAVRRCPRVAHGHPVSDLKVCGDLVDGVFRRCPRRCLYNVVLPGVLLSLVEKSDQILVARKLPRRWSWSVLFKPETKFDVISQLVLWPRVLVLVKQDISRLAALEPTSIRLDVTRWVFVGKKIGIRFRKAVLGELLRGWVHVGRNKPLNPCVADARRRTDDLKVEGSGSFGLVVREDRRSSNRPNKVDSGAGRVKGVVFWSKALERTGDHGSPHAVGNRDRDNLE